MRGQATRSLPGRRLPAGPPPRWPARSQPHLARDGQQIPRSITMGAASRLLPGRRQPRPRPSAAGPPGNPGWIFFFFSYAKAQAPPQRPCSYQEPSANYHSKSTRLLLPCGRHSEALVLLLSGRPPLQALLPGTSALQPTQPRQKKSKPGETPSPAQR